MVLDAETMLKRYANADSLLQCAFSTTRIPNSILFPNWIGDTDVFWYERCSKAGREYRMVNARDRSNEPAFDHAALADALARATGSETDKDALPISDISFSDDARSMSFTADKRFWTFDLDASDLSEIDPAPLDEVVSPNGEHIVFVKNHNLWLRDPNDNTERQLTFDGEEHYRYGAVGRAWGSPTVDERKLQAVWSSDSKRILTVQRDTRNVETLPVVHHLPGEGALRPTVDNIKIAYPGDEDVEDYRIVAIDVTDGTVVKARHAKCPTIRNSGGFLSDGLGWWSGTSETAYFVHVDRYYKSAKLVEFDTTNGETRTLFEEVSDTHIQLADNADESPTVLPLPESDELIWYSNRSGWGHLYLYSTVDGSLKRAITSGEWVVRDLVFYSRERREVFLQTSSRRDGVHPHYKDLIKVNIDTGDVTELAVGEYAYSAAHQRSFPTIIAGSFGAAAKLSNAVSPTGDYFVASHSRLDKAPESVLYDETGDVIMRLESADLSELPDGWNWPESVRFMSDDGEHEICGCIYRPSDFSEDKKYPVVSQLFSTPELCWLPEGSFACDGMFGYSFFIGAALAELGFIVVQFAGRGTTGRSKSFLDHSYGDLQRASDLSDHVSGIKRLTEKYPYMDLDRVGVVSDQGGPGGVHGLLEYPDFYKVGVAGTIHDSRLMSATLWGDKYEGPRSARTRTYPEDKVDQLRGKLLLMHSMLDTTTPPASVFRVIQALIDANKDFDMLLLPRVGHGVSNYATRRSWDYLVTHLLGAELPAEYALKGYHWAS